MKKIINIPKEFLIQEYIINRRTIKQTAKKYNCSITPITKNLKKYNISIRTISEAISGENHFRYGKKCPEISKRMKGKNNPFYGTHPNHKGKNNPRYIGGNSNLPYPLEFNESLKEKIRDRDNYKCQKCGCPEIENGRKLDVHHIDYNKENCDANNLISLCLSCNLKVNSNRDYWKEYFKKIYKCNRR